MSDDPIEGINEQPGVPQRRATISIREHAEGLLQAYLKSRFALLHTDEHEDLSFRHGNREFLEAQLRFPLCGCESMVRLTWRIRQRGPLLSLVDLPETLAPRVATVLIGAVEFPWERRCDFVLPIEGRVNLISDVTSSCGYNYRLAASGPLDSTSHDRNWEFLTPINDRPRWLRVCYDANRWREKRELELRIKFAVPPRVVIVELRERGTTVRSAVVNRRDEKRRLGRVLLVADDLAEPLTLRIRDAHLDDWIQGRTIAGIHPNDVEGLVVSDFKAPEPSTPGSVDFAFCRRAHDHKRFRELTTGVWMLRIEEEVA